LVHITRCRLVRFTHCRLVRFTHCHLVRLKTLFNEAISAGTMWCEPFR
jgi:hypothetical protein